MLAKITPMTGDFHALARYLVEGRGNKMDPNRVAWTMTQNLCTDDPDLAAKIMTATAFLSARTKHPAYHMIIAWHREEQPTPETMQEIATRTLDMAGLGAHQALIMGHGDTPHRHLHMMINRVHPDTHRAWKASHDYALFDRIMRTLSDDHGFHYAPAHRYNLDATDDLSTTPNSRATYAAKRGARTNRPQWSKRESRAFADRINDDLDLASTWDDLHELLSQHELTLEKKGEGYVVGNGASYTKLSSLGLSKTAHGFSKRITKRKKPILPIDTVPTRHRKPIFTVDEIDMARIFVNMGLIEQDAVRQAVEEAVTARQEHVGDMTLSEKLSHQALATTMLSRKDEPRAYSKSIKSSPRKRAAQSAKRR